jgi:hypothetical protein
MILVPDAATVVVIAYLISVNIVRIIFLRLIAQTEQTAKLVAVHRMAPVTMAPIHVMMTVQKNQDFKQARNAA